MSPRGHFCTLSLVKRNKAASWDEPKKCKLPSHPSSVIFDVCIAGTVQVGGDTFWQYPPPEIALLWLLGIERVPFLWLKPHTHFTLCKNRRHITWNIKLARLFLCCVCSSWANGFREVASLVLSPNPATDFAEWTAVSGFNKGFFSVWLCLRGREGGKERRASPFALQRRTHSIIVKYSLPGTLQQDSLQHWCASETNLFSWSLSLWRGCKCYLSFSIKNTAGGAICLAQPCALFPDAFLCWSFYVAICS